MLGAVGSGGILGRYRLLAAGPWVMGVPARRRASGTAPSWRGDYDAPASFRDERARRALPSTPVRPEHGCFRHTRARSVAPEQRQPGFWLHSEGGSIAEPSVPPTGPEDLMSIDHRCWLSWTRLSQLGPWRPRFRPRGFLLAGVIALGALSVGPAATFARGPVAPSQPHRSPVHHADAGLVAAWGFGGGTGRDRREDCGCLRGHGPRVSRW